MTLLALMAIQTTNAQEEVADLTLFREFEAATVTLTNGKKTKVRMANIFLKDASLLYKDGEKTMQANMEPVVSVDMGKRHFLKINKRLGECIFTDSVSGNSLYCVSIVDLDAYKRQLQNATIITNLSLNENMGVTTAELLPTDERLLPLVRFYHMQLKGQFVEVHERPLKRVLSKEQNQRMRSQMARAEFSWTNPESLKELLVAISRVKE
jgi:hypothetical protein